MNVFYFHYWGGFSDLGQTRRSSFREGRTDTTEVNIVTDVRWQIPTLDLVETNYLVSPYSNGETDGFYKLKVPVKYLWVLKLYEGFTKTFRR